MYTCPRCTALMTDDYNRRTSRLDGQDVLHCRSCQADSMQDGHGGLVELPDYEGPYGTRTSPKVGSIRIIGTGLYPPE